jgi:hypothetical protein
MVAGSHTVHGLVEADVTVTLHRLRIAHGSGTVTALVVAAVGATVRKHPGVNSPGPAASWSCSRTST